MTPAKPTATEPGWPLYAKLRQCGVCGDWWTDEESGVECPSCGGLAR